jgi:DNA-directed RNA polymerase subunit RPC12/RpoP
MGERVSIDSLESGQSVFIYSYDVADDDITIAELSDKREGVYVECQHCGHFGYVATRGLIKHGPAMLVSEAQRSYVCRVCGERNAKLLSTRPRTGQRICPKCGRQRWRRLYDRSPKRSCTRCGGPM